MERLNVSYDADGNMLNGPLGEGAQNGFVYDPRGRLVQCGQITYAYDAEDNRIHVGSHYGPEKKNFSYSYVYDKSSETNEVIIRYNGMKASAEWRGTYYVHGMGLEYEVVFDANNNEVDVRYYHYDHLGSTIALSDASGDITDRWTYDLWGYNKHVEGIHDTPYLYIGAYGIQTDPNGLVYMRARYYNPTTKSFLSEDPAQDGSNWYLYASGSPLMRIDVNGMWDGSAVQEAKHSFYTNAFQQKMTAELSWNTPMAKTARALIPYMDIVARQEMGEFHTKDAFPSIAAESLMLMAGGVGRAFNGAKMAGRTIKMINPSKVRFSQNSMKSTFKDGRKVRDLVEGLKNGTISSESIEPIRLVRKGGKLVSIDNRRLWAFKEANMKIPYRMATTEEIAKEFQRKYRTTNAGISIRIRGE